jgi:peptidoglycan/xylan/chitin deacetylase (PgdA/CDA1 family)
MKPALLTCAKYGGLFAAARAMTRRSLRVLAYHGLWTSPGTPFGECLFMPVDQFAERMRWLKASGYPVLDLEDALLRFRDGTLPDNAVVITIDDGWRSTYTHMLPILSELGLPSTLYASTYYMEKQTIVVNVALNFVLERSPAASLSLRDLLPVFPEPILLGEEASRAREATRINQAIDEIPALADRVATLLHIAERAGVRLDADGDQFRYMTLAELAEANNAGMGVQLHTHRHQNANIGEELSDNRAAIARVGIAGEKRHFCYPSGVILPGEEEALASSGIDSATTTRRGLNAPGANLHRLDRMTDGLRLSQIEFEAWLSGFTEPRNRWSAARK